MLFSNEKDMLVESLYLIMVWVLSLWRRHAPILRNKEPILRLLRCTVRQVKVLHQHHCPTSISSNFTIDVSLLSALAAADGDDADFFEKCL